MVIDEFTYLNKVLFRLACAVAWVHAFGRPDKYYYRSNKMTQVTNLTSYVVMSESINQLIINK